jgi:tetraacyldisaccharide 4'-kinase
MPPKYWQSRRHPLAIVLWPVSKLFGAARFIRAKCYDWGIFKTNKLPVPVVVVGNVVAGGVGKTPIVITIVQRLQSLGYKPGVVSRGYGRKAKDCQIITTSSTADDVGDEPLLIAHACQAPVAVASSRVQAAKALLARYPECNVIVSDDGLQHRALGRDIEVVVFDERGVGNNWLLPAGPLREPWPRKALCPVHLTLQNVPRHLAEHALDNTGHFHLLTNLATLVGRPLHAIAGIAKPEAFFGMLRVQGLTLASSTAYADHDNFAKFKPSPDKNALWLCTEKDAVKLWTLYPQIAWQILAVPLVVELDSTFFAALDATIKAQILK